MNYHDDVTRGSTVSLDIVSNVCIRSSEGDSYGSETDDLARAGEVAP